MSKVLLFAESLNDSLALKELILGLCPTLASGQIRVLREPPTLHRSAKPAAMTTWVDRALQAIRGAQVAVGDVTCIFVHCDADGPDDGTFASRRSELLEQAGLTNVHAVVPVEEIEAWWLLFPDATESVVPTWRNALRRAPQDVDRISNPKKELIRRTRDKQPRRPYQEADSAPIAHAIAAGGHLKRRLTGSSRSFEAFKRNVGACCDRLSAP